MHDSHSCQTAWAHRIELREQRSLSNLGQCGPFLLEYFELWGSVLYLDELVGFEPGQDVVTCAHQVSSATTMSLLECLVCQLVAPTVMIDGIVILIK